MLKNDHKGWLLRDYFLRVVGGWAGDRFDINDGVICKLLNYHRVINENRRIARKKGVENVRDGLVLTLAHLPRITNAQNVAACFWMKVCQFSASVLLNCTTTVVGAVHFPAQ